MKTQFTEGSREDLKAVYSEYLELAKSNLFYVKEAMEETECKKKIGSLVETMNSLEMDIGHLESLIEKQELNK